MFRYVAHSDLLGVVVCLVADGRLTPLSLQFSAGDLSDAFRVLLDVLFAAAAGVTSTNEFGVVLEARRDSFAAMRVSLYKLDHLCFLLASSPLLEGGEVLEDEGVAVVGVA